MLPVELNEIPFIVNSLQTNQGWEKLLKSVQAEIDRLYLESDTHPEWTGQQEAYNKGRIRSLKELLNLLPEISAFYQAAERVREAQREYA